MVRRVVQTLWFILFQKQNFCLESLGLDPTPNLPPSLRGSSSTSHTLLNWLHQLLLALLLMTWMPLVYCKPIDCDSYSGWEAWKFTGLFLVLFYVVSPHPTPYPHLQTGFSV